MRIVRDTITDFEAEIAEGGIVERIRNIQIGRAVVAGLIGTVVMTAVGLWVAPLMGMPAMNPAQMLAGAMGGSLALGWMAHFMIGAILAVGYSVVAPSLPGAPAMSMIRSMRMPAPRTKGLSLCRCGWTGW